MIRVDQRHLELATRVRDATLDSVGGTIADFFILGKCFHSAWLTGSEIRRGIKPSSHDIQEYRAVKDSLERCGWIDLLDE